MSLVKFTELPSGSIQGGDVLAVAGASSYKVTAVEHANWINKRLQGNTDKTVEFVYNLAKGNSDYTTNVVNPQLGQIGTNKTDIGNAFTAINHNTLLTVENKNKLTNLLKAQGDNEPAVVASMIKDDNFIKNPAAHSMVNYWEERTGIPMKSSTKNALDSQNLMYPGWSRGGDLLTYNFTVALDGVLTIGQLGGNNAPDLEYRVNAGAWVKVGGSGITQIGVGYAGVHSAGAQISVRMHKDSGGIAFAIPSPAYWLTPSAAPDTSFKATIEKLTLGLRRKRIEFEACGYWFGMVQTIPPSLNALRPVNMGNMKNVISIQVKPTSNTQVHYVMGQVDPDHYNQCEVY